MKASDYIKRILDELPWRGAKSLPKLSANFASIAMGLGGVLVTLFAILIFFGPSDNRADDCIFYITEADAPAPITAGDAVQRLDTCVKFETVASPSSRTLGLSGRTSLAWDHGMLFDFEKPGEYCMWMKDMNFSLDMLWMDEERSIVAMRKGVSPETYPKSFCGPETARYVLEVNAGVIEAGDLRLGQRLKL